MSTLPLHANTPYIATKDKLVISNSTNTFLVKRGVKTLAFAPLVTHSYTHQNPLHSPLFSPSSLSAESLSLHLSTIFFISSSFSSLSRHILHHPSLYLHFEVRTYVACWIWSRNGALVLMSLGSPFWGFLKMSLRCSWWGLCLHLTKTHSCFITFGHDL